MGFIDPSPFNVVKTFKNVFLIIFGFFCCQDYFAHSEPSQSSFRAKMGDPGHKSRAWVVFLMPLVRLQPSGDRDDKAIKSAKY